MKNFRQIYLRGYVILLEKLKNIISQDKKEYELEKIKFLF